MGKQYQYGAFDVFEGKIPAWLKHGESWLRKNFGPPCKFINPSCVSCRVWSAWVNLQDQLVTHDINHDNKAKRK